MIRDIFRLKIALSTLIRSQLNGIIGPDLDSFPVYVRHDG